MKRFSLLLALAMLAMLFGACSSQATPPSTPQATTINTPDRVDIVYFYKSNPCACMQVVGDYIQQVVILNFQEQVDNGKLTLKMVISDTPDNAALVKKYNSPPFWLYITTVRGDTETVHSVPDIWGLTGDKDKLAAYLENTIQKALEGRL
ncbi:MAG: hypothetical protein FJZ94_04620 [Chloroflexi bacterium]|nr:hypothetical protein [Chloroflexota bacterium]